MMNKLTLRWMVLTALIAAICVIGSFIKVPGFITTAALDSAPAMISVAFLPPLYSGFAGLIGHIATAYTSGFPSGPFHIIIAVEMFIILYVFNVLHQKSFNVLKWVFLILANGLLAPLPFYFLVAPQFYFGAVPTLLVATLINAIIAIVAIPVVKKVYSRSKVMN